MTQKFPQKFPKSPKLPQRNSLYVPETPPEIPYVSRNSGTEIPYVPEIPPEKFPMCPSRNWPCPR